MLASAVVYCGLIIAFAGLLLLVRPMPRFRVRTRKRAAVVAALGIGLLVLGVLLPAPESRAIRVQTRLDAFAPAWQFREFHQIRIAAPPDRVFQAMRSVTADEILLFRFLTWVRRGGQQLPESILNAGKDASLIDIATRSGFVRLADDPPSELVIGTVISAPPGTKGELTPEVFQRALRPGFVLATMNFVVRADGPGASIVSTETRVHANSPSARRRFAAYWRVIYPGSVIIRRMWLRAIKRRATSSAARG